MISEWKHANFLRLSIYFGPNLIARILYAAQLFNIFIISLGMFFGGLCYLFSLGIPSAVLRSILCIPSGIFLYRYVTSADIRPSFGELRAIA